MEKLMPAPLKIDKEAVRVLAKAIGVRQAAREMGIPEKTVLHWSMKEGWAAEGRAIERLRAERSQSPSVKTASEALADVMAEDGQASKVAGMRYARKTLEHAARVAEAAPADALGIAQDVKAVLQSAALAGGWAAAGGTTVNVAVALRLNMD